MIIFVAAIMTFTFIGQCFAINEVNDGTIGNDAITVVYDVVEALNSHNWYDFISYQVNENKVDYTNFLNNNQNKVAHLGLFNINTASIYEIKELPSNKLNAFANITNYSEKYDDIKGYIVGIDYSVIEESKYFFNGVNYRLVIVGKEDVTWKVIELSDAPIEIIDSMGLGFGSDAEDKALEIVNERIEGNVVDSKGRTITMLSTAKSDSEHVKPDYVRVYRVSLSTTQKVDLYSYVKNVLPNEWVASWPVESLKTGAMATKMYGWYHTYHPKWSSLNADVKDTTADQVYKPGTEHANTTAAINAVGNMAFENSAGKIFETQYVAGERGTAGVNWTGKISQNGSKYLAEKGYSYLSISNYYYSHSDKSTGAINYFTY